MCSHSRSVRWKEMILCPHFSREGNWSLGTWSKAPRFLWGCRLQSPWPQHPDDQRLSSLQGSVFWWLLETWAVRVLWFRFRTCAISELVVTLYFTVFHPHQLTFLHFLPQWLVKRAIETKEEMGDYIRSYSISQFQKTYSLPEVSVLLFSCPAENLSAQLGTPWKKQSKLRLPCGPPQRYGVSAPTWSALNLDLLVHLNCPLWMGTECQAL